MPRKDEILSELLARKTREIVARSGNYAAFLRTAARNYKYTFREQVLIHAQRPDATSAMYLTSRIPTVGKIEIFPFGR